MRRSGESLKDDPKVVAPTSVSRRKMLQLLLLGLAAPMGTAKTAFAQGRGTFYRPKIRIFYRPEMVLRQDAARNYSKSPLKPKLFLQFLRQHAMLKYFEVFDDWEPFRRKDFLIAHTKKYMEAFFAGIQPLASSNLLSWSRQFADSVRYTNASLYHALDSAVRYPRTIAFSPSSGFHHATPEAGSGFCTFSGQVLASVRIYRKYGVSGAYLDLDGHYGNSIEDSRNFVKDLNEAVPPGCNINPVGAHQAYLKDLQTRLQWIRKQLLTEKIHYIVFAHGADSHQWDDLGGQLTTKEWLEASRLVYGFIDGVSRSLGRPVPLVLTLFGGYRRDAYNSVLSLHAADVALCLSILCKNEPAFRPVIKPPEATETFVERL